MLITIARSMCLLCFDGGAQAAVTPYFFVKSKRVLNIAPSVSMNVKCPSPFFSRFTLIFLPSIFRNVSSNQIPWSGVTMLSSRAY